MPTDQATFGVVVETDESPGRGAEAGWTALVRDRIRPQWCVRYSVVITCFFRRGDAKRARPGGAHAPVGSDVCTPDCALLRQTAPCGAFTYTCGYSVVCDATEWIDFVRVQFATESMAFLLSS
jgi:hypothetical protein